MEPEPISRVAAPVPDEGRLAELVKAIRDGVADADADLHRIFHSGACFLIRRRLGQIDADSHARSVLDAVVRKIREDHSVDGRNLPGLVRQLIVQNFPAARSIRVAKDGADRPAVTAAERILRQCLR